MSDGRNAIGVPLVLSPSFDAKTWGGRRLEQYGKTLPPGPIGEALESGPDARVAGGPFDGLTLGELSRNHSAALLGQRGLVASGALQDFPLLIKLIDAHEDLSVQVHPDDASAPAGKRGKTEAWYILDAEPDARIVTGVEGAIDIDRIAERLTETVVQPGEVYFVPAGTVHAIGAGVLLYEIQQASDVTWRLYDWGRPREIHVEQALAVAREESRVSRVEPRTLDSGRDLLVACEYFALERWKVSGVMPLRAMPESFRVVTVLDGGVTVGDTHLMRGVTAVLPADLDATQLDGSGVLLIGYIPDGDVSKAFIQTGAPD